MSAKGPSNAGETLMVSNVLPLVTKLSYMFSRDSQ